MRTGLELLLTDKKHLITDRRLGLVINHTSVDRDLNFSLNRFLADPDLRVIRLFGPEHGIRGDAQDMIAVDEAMDPDTSLPVVSLYGVTEDSLRPKAAHLADLDALVFDIQDIGARYYTFVYTLAYCMEAAAEAGIPVIVCDRPNPIGGVAMEGNLLEMEYRSFVGRYPLPVRHGMTVGELALFFRDVCGIRAEVQVVPMEGWERSQYFEETGLAWVQPSPNMPTVDTAIVYPGMCLLEGTNVSEGRGTTRPFHLSGAPWVKAGRLADALNEEALPGVRWRATAFTPQFHKFARSVCYGVEVHVIDRCAFQSLLSGIALLHHLRRLHPEFAWRTERYEFVSDRLAIDLLAGGTFLRESLSEDLSIKSYPSRWAEDLERFQKTRASCLLY